MTDHLRIAYAANRAIGLKCLQALLGEPVDVCCLLVAETLASDYVEALSQLAPAATLVWVDAPKGETLSQLQVLAPDYLLSVHFPSIIDSEILRIPHRGALNLHPALLPYNRGWHTPSWAIIEGTPFGATLHWIDSGLDTGPIALQVAVETLPEDTAHSLYQRTLRAEEALFREGLQLLLEGSLPMIPQVGEGTSHRKQELDTMREIRLTSPTTASEILRKLRALTTNDWDEAAYFYQDGRKFLVRVDMREATTPERKNAHPS